MLNYITLVALVLCAAASSAWAGRGDTWMEVYGFSYHDDPDRTYNKNGVQTKYNEVNHGLGIAYELTDAVEFSGGAYENSYDETSVFGAVGLKHDFFVGDVTVTPGVKVGLASGYNDDGNTEYNIGSLRPGGTAFVRVGYDRVRVEVGIMPTRVLGFNGVNVYTVHFGVKF